MLDLKNLEKSIQRQIDALDETTTEKEILILVKALEVVTGAITFNDVVVEGKKQIVCLGSEGQKQVRRLDVEGRKQVDILGMESKKQIGILAGASNKAVAIINEKLKRLEAREDSIEAIVKRQIKISELTK